MSTERIHRGPEVVFEWSRELGRTNPEIAVVFERAELKLPVMKALIDTGADVSILPRVGFIANAPPILGRDALFGPMELRINRYEIGLRAVEWPESP